MIGTQKILGFIILHYGAPYLRSVLMSLKGQVDHIVILYSDTPSQGFLADTICPDTRHDLMRCCDGLMDNVTWVDGRWNNEHEHTNAIFQFTEGYDYLFRLDSDEVIPDGFVENMVKQANSNPYKFCRVPIVHHWRSFDRVCRDGQMPMRLYKLNSGEGEGYLDSNNGEWHINHMSYCMPDKYIRYKLQVSGHKSEFRQDWYVEKWLKNAQLDVHPVCMYGFWNPEPYVFTKRFPTALLLHPNFGKELIS